MRADMNIYGRTGTRTQIHRLRVCSSNRLTYSPEHEREEADSIVYDFPNNLVNFDSPGGWIRTNDLQIMILLLFQLSYTGKILRQFVRYC